MLVPLEENALMLFQGMLLINAVSMWFVILPLGYLSAFVWQWSAIAVYAVLCMDEFVKLPFVALRFRQYKWLKNLTDNSEGGESNAENL